jgi:hypothetical protein
LTALLLHAGAPTASARQWAWSLPAGSPTISPPCGTGLLARPSGDVEPQHPCDGRALGRRTSSEPSLTPEVQRTGSAAPASAAFQYGQAGSGARDLHDWRGPHPPRRGTARAAPHPRNSRSLPAGRRTSTAVTSTVHVEVPTRRTAAGIGAHRQASGAVFQWAAHDVLRECQPLHTPSPAGRGVEPPHHRGQQDHEALRPRQDRQRVVRQGEWVDTLDLYVHIGHGLGPGLRVLSQSMSRSPRGEPSALTAPRETSSKSVRFLFATRACGETAAPR